MVSSWKVTNEGPTRARNKNVNEASEIIAEAKKLKDGQWMTKDWPDTPEGIAEAHKLAARLRHNPNAMAILNISQSGNTVWISLKKLGE